MQCPFEAECPDAAGCTQVQVCEVSEICRAEGHGPDRGQRRSTDDGCQSIGDLSILRCTSSQNENRCICKGFIAAKWQGKPTIDASCDEDGAGNSKFAEKMARLIKMFGCAEVAV